MIGRGAVIRLSASGKACGSAVVIKKPRFLLANLGESFVLVKIVSQINKLTNFVKTKINEFCNVYRNTLPYFPNAL